MIFSKVKYFFCKIQDILLTDMLYVPSSILKWCYHRRIKKDIACFILKDSSGKKANLYSHGSIPREKEGRVATFVLHGFYSHPFVMLHVSKMALKNKLGPVYSLYISYDQVNYDHRDLIKQALDKIEEISLKQGKPLEGIIMVGHSMGAIESAHTAFVEKDQRIKAVISIAGRLKVVDSVMKPCGEFLKNSVNKIYEGIQAFPKIPLYQIVCKNDWNAPIEATLVRKTEGFYHIVENAMHFNILFHPDFQKKFPEFLLKSSKN